MYKADEQRERDRHADRERAPRAVLERVDDGEAEPGERDDDDEEDGDRGGRARDRADLGARDVGERAPPRRVDAHRMIMSCTAPARQTPPTSQISPGA